MKFRYGQNHTVIQTIKHKITGATNRYVVCKFDDNGELETNDPKLIHILKTKLPGCTWDEEDNIEVKTEEVKEILSDEELKKEDLKRFCNMSYKELQVAYAKKTGNSAVGKKKDFLLKELEG
jgi:hypothetical protein